ncbi:MAG: hypothetical protein EF813_10025 [Methanosarcinales archaeon]|nr:MAG: hypothetical protein EF813_10025 [Methanosarcinales archaeon]
MSRYIPDIRAIRSFVILYADFITNFTNVPNATNFNRLFSGKPLKEMCCVCIGATYLFVVKHSLHRPILKSVSMIRNSKFTDKTHKL